MYNEHYYCIILAGGVGSRFWPISRKAMPKQFLDFTDSGKSFLRLTYERFSTVVPESNIIVVTLGRYADIVRGQLPELEERNLLLEPYSRNTAPCMAYVTRYMKERDPEAVMVVSPSDHIIRDTDLFRETVSSALDYACNSDKLLSLGIVPSCPDPNFGYIQVAGEIRFDGPVGVKTFTEKPDEALARVFVESGEFLWNSGIFVWKNSAICRELETYAPEITDLWAGWEKVYGTGEEEKFKETVYSECPRISIDYAVMEKTRNAMVYPARFSWADIGNWSSLYDYLSRHDENGNASNFRGKSLLRESSHNVIFAGNSDKLVAIRGLDNYIVIDTDDVLLICPRDDAKFKNILSELALPEYEEYR